MTLVSKSDLIDFCTDYVDRAADAEDKGVMDEQLDEEFLSLKLPADAIKDLLEPGDGGPEVVGLMGLLGIHEYQDGGVTKKATTVTLVPCKEDASGNWVYRNVGSSADVGEERFGGDPNSRLDYLKGTGSPTTAQKIQKYLEDDLGM